MLSWELVGLMSFSIRLRHPSALRNSLLLPLASPFASSPAMSVGRHKKYKPKICTADSTASFLKNSYLWGG